MILNYDKFIKEIYETFKEDFTIEEIKHLLRDVVESDRDTPISTGKRLLLTRIRIDGEKSSGETINFTMPFQSGVNLILADNLKGKSSIFKMIQLALTGNNKLKKDVKKWIHSINLGFKINGKDYSAIIKIKNSRMKGSLYSQIINDVNELNQNILDPIFEANGYEEYKQLIQEFFFKQFSYYSLKWTQKASQKDKNELNESNASWKTYFKSIYLESKDSTKLIYGAQDKKILQMLLGLELTYTINALEVKCDMLTFNKAKQGDLNNKKQYEDEKALLENRKKEIDKEIAILNSSNLNSSTLNHLYESYENIIEQINSENSLTVEKGELANKKAKELNSLTSQISENTVEKNRIERELNKTIRLINDIEEYLEIGSFFANLDISYCPSCNHKLTKNHSKHDHNCLLCHEPVDKEDNEINKEVYIQKINELTVTKDNLVKEKDILKNNITQLKEKHTNVKQSFLEIESTLKMQNNISILKEQLKDIEQKVNDKKINIDDEKIIELTAEKAVIEYRLSEQGSQSNTELQKKEGKKIDVINLAINRLNTVRYENSQKILSYLSDIMLKELHYFGLNSISEIKVTENFDIKYKQDDDYITFDEIAEGEQLRAKIALYLALIQLDIMHNFGRHTRFLIIDSPNKEEGDSQYLSGLSETLKDIDNRYGESLQIIIGTAERKLANTVNNEIIFEEGEYLF
ncbi:hypothetical protein [Rummeliibacillus suwonensis]|uniref:hypothetical protein n=1 Tax=Rummeliibacillus suwonensis TaxID=1306154 RepID=UPI001AAF3A7F|nr:hypothetical protein [Rummeliibacillus suwonensis]MBO2536545.1 hypothetical protein [Rummeliibacillus suwonensis]